MAIIAAKLRVGDRARTKNMDGMHNNVTGTIDGGFFDEAFGFVYILKYDNPFGSCKTGMFKQSDLEKIDDQ